MGLDGNLMAAEFSAAGVTMEVGATQSLNSGTSGFDRPHVQGSSLSGVRIE